MIVRDLFKRVNLNIIDYIDICKGECLAKNHCTSLNSLAEGKVIDGKINLNSKLLKKSVDRYELLSAKDYKENILLDNCTFITDYKIRDNEKVLRILIEA